MVDELVPAAIDVPVSATLKRTLRSVSHTCGAVPAWAQAPAAPVPAEPVVATYADMADLVGKATLVALELLLP